MSAEENLQRMKTLDDAWNAQNREVFRKRHSVGTKVYWPVLRLGRIPPANRRTLTRSETKTMHDILPAISLATVIR